MGRLFADRGDKRTAIAALLMPALAGAGVAVVGSAQPGVPTLVAGLLATGSALALGYRLIKVSLLHPLTDLEERAAGLAAGDRASDIPHCGRNDPIGAIGRSLARLRDEAVNRTTPEALRTPDEEQQRAGRILASHLDRLAAGDLSARIGEDFPAGQRALRDSFNSAVEGLGGLIRSVAQSTGAIRTGSQEIAQASEDLARRTESNAAGLEETSAAIQQMDGRLKASASASTATVGRADQAIATVSGGRALADEAVSAMGRVSDSARGIDSVIEGLDKIAFQTRVLAMNAAVEAGRAGEAGRGFAVVADLVSALAMRAEEEAKRARGQLTVTQTDIVAAVEAVEKVDHALQNISSDVDEVHQLLGQMASDNQAQALAITEINAAIASMDQSTQQNAAMVEQTSAAARNLLAEASRLAEQAGRFRGADAGPALVSPPTGEAPAPAAKGPVPVAAKAKTAAAEETPAKAPVSLPKHGKEGSYQSPVRSLPAVSLHALASGSTVSPAIVGATAGEDDD
ncbi:hypothetical protein GCM10022280_04420 [Sphingomonas swuensis]|uniref:Methyl-accepting chemotaxis protein n=1 Tax=Sphingomonas swuensis TaxID=977800 RepID=A0ABP7SDM2_9SPHN